MDVFAQFAAEIDAAVKALQAQGALPAEVALKGVSVEPPRDPAHGDIATNAALTLAKSAGMPPRDLAAQIAARLEGSDDVAGVEVAGPGFINVRLNDDFWPKVVAAILEQGPAYGRSEVGRGFRGGARSRVAVKR